MKKTLISGLIFIFTKKENFTHKIEGSLLAIKVVVLTSLLTGISNFFLSSQSENFEIKSTTKLVRELNKITI